MVLNPKDGNWNSTVMCWGWKNGREMQLKKGKIHDMIFCEKEGKMMGAGNQADLKRQETLKAIETLSLFR